MKREGSGREESTRRRRGAETTSWAFCKPLLRGLGVLGYCMKKGHVLVRWLGLWRWLEARSHDLRRVISREGGAFDA